MNQEQAEQFIEEYVHDMIDICPHCGAKVHIEKLWSNHHTLKNSDVEFYVIFRCKPCRKLILKTYYFRQNPYSSDTNLEGRGWDEKFPISLDTELNREDAEYIPEQVFADYSEALKCKSMNANRASCSMFRRSLQNGILELGADDKLNLIDQIDSLSNLPSDIKDWAHQIRIFGNWGAHPDKDNLKEVDQDDVKEVHDFISKFFTYMFIMPEKVKLSRKKRDEKINSKQENDSSK